MPARLLRLAPVILLLVSAAALAWPAQGSIAAADWLPAALLSGLVVTVLLVARGAGTMSNLQLAALTGFAGLSAWTAISIAWSPAPSLARDEALLVALYVFVLATPSLALRFDGDRIDALAVVALGLGLLALATGAALALGDAPDRHFRDGRLFFPITYVNAQAALALVGVWPALVLASRRESSIALRAAALGSAAAMLGVWLLTQSAGAAVALAASAVVIAVLAPDRLRLLVPAAIAAAAVAFAFRPLTAPFDALPSQLEDAARGGGGAVVALAVAVTALGGGYAFLDGRIALAPRARTLLGRAAGGVAAAGAVAALIALLAAGNPRAAVQERWDSFSADPVEEEGGTHFTSFGSERPDFWRVAAGAIREHPIAGVGARGFGTLYRQEGRSDEYPERAHSLPLDVLAETGAVGFGLFALGVAPLLALAVRLRRRPWGVAAIGTASYWFVHAAGDWLWTVPAATIPLFLVLGIAASEDRPVLGRRVSLAAAAVTGLVTLLAFAPPWLSSRYTTAALRSGDPAGLARARQLDPLSVEPLLAESALATAAADRIRPLRDAVAREPRSAPLRFLLASAYAEAGQQDAAGREASRAVQLDPRSQARADAILP